ncbi:Cyclopropane-fatty-acyl-phospholipid synthase [Thermodesulfobium narugense DSM 14796]|uniref:Cyclopropane-fatty-acyl-phospholipid synthase n=1 Tax=Thermodesulfobium narugense DSM 14796 TaxID=747365 RepID=M1E509_9BACT|nr:cyclopropane-fatty-acyl-phospholipid synthase family protein [Thermodesulfobium narugense]AEE14727.1 Cyclopropane-fatty-acyl-phospholipid synthase [Thermodesulfobium narugense DSM 14796]
MNRTEYELYFKTIGSKGFRVVYWDKETSDYGVGDCKFTINFKKNPSDLFIKEQNLRKIIEENFEEILDIEGNPEEICSVFGFSKEIDNFKAIKKQILLCIAEFLMNVRKERQKKEVQSHYDLGNDFFSLWLDDTMTYSCAYFKDPNMSLRDAQIEKINHTLKKLNLKKDERLLDIGSGWGLLIVKAAQDYGVKSMGITLSEEQFKATKDLIKRLGLEDRVQVRLMNYLDLDENQLQFDKIVSVGMFEHVGKENLEKYFDKVNKLLVNKGLSLLHTINLPEVSEEDSFSAWLKKYIFPGGYIPELKELISILPKYDFHLMHLESLRMNYALTLDKWYENFSSHTKEIEEKFGRQFARRWGFYLKGCANAFRTSGLDVHQLLFSKGLNNDMPLTFEYIYK